MANNMFKHPPSGSDAPSEAGPGGEDATSASKEEIPYNCTCHWASPEAKKHCPVHASGTALEKAAAAKMSMVTAAQAKRQEAEDRFLAMLDNVNSLDWEDLPVPVLAKMLMAKPIKGRKDEPDRYMTGVQALIYASACKALNAGCANPLLKLNPWLNDMWVDLDTMKVNITVEGQRKVSARRGDLGIPTWVEVTRKLERGMQKPMAWMTTDIGYECTIEIRGQEKPVKQIAWLTNWFKPTPIWRENWEHMLKVRSEGLCYENITGVGISQAHIDREVLTEDAKPAGLPVVAATKFVEAADPDIDTSGRGRDRYGSLDK